MKKLKWLVAVSVTYIILAVFNILYVGIPMVVLQFLLVFTYTLPWWNNTVKRLLKIK